MTMTPATSESPLPERMRRQFIEQVQRLRGKIVELLSLDAETADRLLSSADYVPEGELRDLTGLAQSLTLAMLSATYHLPIERISPLLVQGLAGLALRQTRSQTRHRPAPAAALDLGGIEGIASLLAGPPEGFDPARFNAAALSFVDFLLATHGPRKFADFVAAFATGSANDASLAAFRKALPVLEQEWREAATVGREAKLSLGDFILRALRFTQPYWPLDLLVVVTMLFQLAYTLLIPVALSYLFDHGILAGDARVVTILLALLTLGFFSHGISGMAQDYVAAIIATRSLNDLRERMFQRLQTLSDGFLQRTNSGEIVSSFSNDLSVVEQALTRAIPNLILRLALMAGSVVVAFAMEWRMALAAFITLPIAFLAPRPISKKAVRAAYGRKADDARLAGMIQETLTLSRVIRVFRLQDNRLAALRAILSDLNRRSIRANILGALVGRITTTGVSFLLLFVIGMGAVLSLYGYVSAGIVVAFILILLNMGAGAAGVAEAIPVLIQATGGMQRIEELLAEQPRVVDPPPGRAQNLDRLRRSIAFDDVTFSYTGKEANLDGVSFTIPVTQSVAFVGPSGSGKSTILNLLLRHHDVSDGRILLDDIDIRNLTDESLRRRMSVVAQDNALFQMSVRDNIRMGRLDATEAEIVAAAKAAEIHDMIVAMAQGYDTDVGELGNRLSGGQRQRIAIARALLRNPELLILDEPTSALDPGAEHAINHTLARLRPGRTTVTVTHQLQQAAEMDCIFVLNRGRLVESGSHEKLLALNGLYAGLWAKQSGLSVSEDGRSASITAERLGEIPFFAGLAADKLRDVAMTLRQETAPAGAILLTEREIGGKFYIIVRGTVVLTVADTDGTPIELEVLETGDFFGEITLLEDVPQVATAQVRAPCTLLTLQREEYLRLVADEPLLYDRAVEIIDVRLQAKLDELVYKRLGLVDSAG
jgi:ATP-binding cassette subfamily B protein